MTFPTALEMKECVRTPADTDTILRLVVLNALYTAASSATGNGSITTGSCSTGSATEQQILAVLADLRKQGFSTTLSTGSFTVTFQR